MITSMVKKQLLAFWTAALVAMVVLAVVFLHVPEALGIGRYTVQVEFQQGAGLYDGAQVNYRGAPIGKVSSMRLTDNGIEASLKLKDDVSVPDDVSVAIHSMSAVGEQYVELVPPRRTPGEGRLEDGDRIASDRTSFPVEIGPVLDNVNALVQSLPRKDLSTVIDEAARAFDGRDTDLQSILDGGKRFLDAADQTFTPTARLVRDTHPLLSTVNAKAARITSLSGKVARVTDELRAGDQDLRALLDNGPGFAGTSTAFLKDVEPTLPGLLGNLGIVSQVLATYRDALAQLLTDYPTALAIVQSTTFDQRAQNQIQLTVSNDSKPGECLNGFLPVSQWRSPFDTSLVEPQLVYCKAPISDPRAVRGARNVPCPENSARREPTAALCRP